MIPLRIRVEGAQGDAPFIVRLKNVEVDKGAVIGPSDAILMETEDKIVSYDSTRGKLRFPGFQATDLSGDVLLVDPSRSIAHRLVRASSPHNTFLITERCDQLCMMCSQPPKPRHVDLFSAFQQAALLAPRGMTIGISGGEPTLYKEELFQLVRRSLAARPDLRFHILTNAQHFDESDCKFLASLPSDKVLWGIPIYASGPALHDEIVGKPGAFDCLMNSFALLARCGATIELRTVLMSNNVTALEPLAGYIASHLPFISVWAIMQLENIGFARKNWEHLFFDNSVYFTPVAEAIDAALGRGLAVALYNFPLCTVPPPYRAFTNASISDWKRRYPTTCDGCKLRNSCGGFFEWYNDKKGFAGVHAI